MLVACATSSGTDAPGDDVPGNSDAGAHDAAPADAGGPDAPVTASPRPGVEVVGAAGTVRASSRRIDVSIGHPVEQRAATAGTRQLSGATVVFP